jgi:hypothetical protein
LGHDGNPLARQLETAFRAIPGRGKSRIVGNMGGFCKGAKAPRESGTF